MQEMHFLKLFSVNEGCITEKLKALKNTPKILTSILFGFKVNTRKYNNTVC